MFSIFGTDFLLGLLTDVFGLQPLISLTDQWSSWSHYSQCSESCGEGVRTKFRDCVAATGVIIHNQWCEGSSELEEVCNYGPCKA